MGIYRVNTSTLSVLVHFAIFVVAIQLRTFILSYKMLPRIVFPFLALAAKSLAAVTYKGYDLSSLAMMEDDEGATFYTSSGASSTALDILSGNSARLRLANPL